jgi:ureidoglycolate dehydrogenase (NAD+)
MEPMHDDQGRAGSAVVESFLAMQVRAAGLTRAAESIVRCIIMSHFARWPRVDVLSEISGDLESLAASDKVVQTYRAARAALDADCSGLPAIACIDEVASFCEESCAENGVAIAAIHNTGGMRTLDIWARYLAERGVIGLITWNGGPYAAVPYGGVEAFFGTNPLSFGIPTSGYPIVADFATTEIAYMDLKRSLDAGRDLPAGAGINSVGEATKDPQQVFVAPDSGRLLPFGGGPKGSALVLLLEVLAGAFSGGVMGRAASDTYTAEEFSGMVLALQPGVFGQERFSAAVEELVGQIRSSAPATGHEKVRLPGDSAASRYATRHSDGIEISARFRRLLDSPG